MPGLTLTLTTAECIFLEHHLEDVLKDTRVEVHRTRTPTYRESILEREQLILSVLAKLRQPPA